LNVILVRLVAKLQDSFLAVLFVIRLKMFWQSITLVYKERRRGRTIPLMSWLQLPVIY
jgi:hypothetical protein